MFIINFKKDNSYDNFLHKFLKRIYAKYKWYIDKNEIIIDYTQNIDYDFNEIFLLSEYYIISASIFAFKKNKNIQKINTYEQFKKSKNCTLIVLITDSVNVEVHCKKIVDLIKLLLSLFTIKHGNLKIDKNNRNRNNYEI